MKQFWGALALAALVAGCNTSPEEMGSSGVDSSSVSGSATIDSSTTTTNGTNNAIQGTSPTTNGTQKGTSPTPTPDSSDTATPQNGASGAQNSNSQSGSEPNGSR